MSLVGGSVTVANDGTASGTGLALALYNARMAKVTADPNWATYTLAQKLPAQRGIADLANADGPAIVTYFQGNATVFAGSMVAHVTAQQVGRDNTAGNPAILAPSAPVDVPITGSGGIS